MHILTNCPKKQEQYNLSKGNRMWSMELVCSPLRTLVKFTACIDKKKCALFECQWF